MAGEDEVDGITAGVTPSSSTAAATATPSALPAATTAPRRFQHAGTAYRPNLRFSFPRAAQPEIVRAYQKDVYYRDLLRDQLQDVARSILGSRTLFAHAETISFLGSVAYFTLSTLGGAQTLGEEYVNAMMTESKSGRIVALRRRIAFIFFHVVSPFLLARVYAAGRRRIVASHQQRSQALQRARLRAAAVAPRRGTEAERAKAKAKEPQPSRIDRLVGFLADRLPSMESFNASDGWLAYASAAHLALFYLGSRYYAFGQRMAGVEYISTIARRPGSKPPSYEVLGFLLGLQLVIKMLLGANRWRVARSKAKREEMLKSEEKPNISASSDEKEVVFLDDVGWSHKTQPPSKADSAAVREPDHGRVPLAYADPDALSSAAELGLDKGASREQLEASRGAARVKAAELEAVAESVLKCTLCMEKREPERGTSAVTECGHVFCWDCIVGWAREKPACPLCRQSLNPSHILPIYNF